MTISPFMAQAQAGLFEEPGNSAHYLECHWPKALPLEKLKEALVEALKPIAGAYIAVGFGIDAWLRMQPDYTPEELVSFPQLVGTNGYEMASTQEDLWFWIHGEDRGDVMNAVLQVQQAVRGLLVINLDLSGFKNREARDLTGFVDGTENDKGDERGVTAQIPEGELGAGGSYVLTQKWKHDLAAFNELSVSEQEKVFGRTKQDDIEMSEEEIPEDAHVNRTDVDIDGVSQKIYRRSTPYGGAKDHGLYFVAFACSLARIHIQLERMLGNTEDGLSDALMNFSEAETGAYWFMPAQQDLEGLLAS